ncbi:hypothetical protein HYN59_12715 [Flavobacterium album]|uniref:Uncharacterized protein n=1 Tax=Flavobacterium album TaxID=2175091 RepID=A0A2S1QZQ2_9FLAO|nr:hypothetical protein [Flavobacterium album]AWH85913.1 hypothetical protein HYN59_12715 [Flavobacterium album]
MRDKLVLILAFIIVIFNGIIGHFFAPNGISFTPIIIIATTSLVAFGTKNVKAIWKSIFAFLFIALNDIFIKLYSGGTHDNEGLEWIHCFTLIGLIPSFIILLITILKSFESKIFKIIAIILFPILVVIYFQLFHDLGLGRHYWYDWNG